MTQEVIKNMLSKLDIMLEFDEGIAVDSVEELISKYDTFVKEFKETFQKHKQKQHCEDEWVESAESCPHYEDEQTQLETHRIAEEYKEELMNQWEEIQKKKTVMTQKEDIEIKPKIISQEDYQKTRLYKLADEYVDEYFDEYFDYRHLRTIETLYGLERANETARNHIRDVYRDGYEDALRDAFLILKQFKEFDGMSFGTFKKELLNG